MSYKKKLPIFFFNLSQFTTLAQPCTQKMKNTLAQCVTPQTKLKRYHNISYTAYANITLNPCSYRQIIYFLTLLDDAFSY